MRTRYTYGCCISQEVNKNYVKLERVMPALTAYFMEEDWKGMQEAIPTESLSHNVFYSINFWVPGQLAVNHCIDWFNLLTHLPIRKMMYPFIPELTRTTRNMANLKAIWPGTKKLPCNEHWGYQEWQPDSCWTEQHFHLFHEKCKQCNRGETTSLRNLYSKVPSAIHPIKVLYEEHG